MLYSWPPTGRLAENISQANKAFSFVPKSKIVGKVGYAVIPGRNGEHAGGYLKTVSADSKNAELAYLHAQWVTSPSISLQRVMLPYALRDPYRISHFKSKQFWSKWPAARQYLAKSERGRQQWRARLRHPGCSGLLQCPRPQDDRDLRGQGRPGWAERARQGVGCDHEEARSREAGSRVAELPHVHRLDEEHHTGEEGPGGHSLSLLASNE